MKDHSASICPETALQCMGWSAKLDALGLQVDRRTQFWHIQYRFIFWTLMPQIQFLVFTWLMCIPWVLSEDSWQRKFQCSPEVACHALSSTSQREDCKMYNTKTPASNNVCCGRSQFKHEKDTNGLVMRSQIFLLITCFLCKPPFSFLLTSLFTKPSLNTHYSHCFNKLPLKC